MKLITFLLILCGSNLLSQNLTGSYSCGCTPYQMEPNKFLFSELCHYSLINGTVKIPKFHATITSETIQLMWEDTVATYNYFFDAVGQVLNLKTENGQKTFTVIFDESRDMILTDANKSIIKFDKE